MRIIAGICAAFVALLAGCGSSEVPTETETSTRAATTTVNIAAAMDPWRKQVIPVIDRLTDALSWIGGAASSLDLADTRAACRELRNVAGELDALLPSPDQLVTQHFEAAVENFGDMARLCQGLSPRTTRAEFAEFSSYQERAMEALEAGVDRIVQVQQG